MKFCWSFPDDIRTAALFEEERLIGWREEGVDEWLFLLNAELLELLVVLIAKAAECSLRPCH